MKTIDPVNLLKNKVTWLVFAGVIILLIVIAIIASSSSNSVVQTAQKSGVLPSLQIDKLQTQLQSSFNQKFTGLTDEIKRNQRDSNAVSDKLNRNVDALSQHVSQISQHVDDLSNQLQGKANTQSVSRLQNSLSGLSESNQAQFNTIIDNLKQIQKAQQDSKDKINEVSADRLPFKILGLHWWQSDQKLTLQDIATGRYALMGLHESYQGWALVGIEKPLSQGDGTVILQFINQTKKEKTQVSL
jgi:hypothetical protein